jgi:hypothetical protein
MPKKTKTTKRKPTPTQLRAALVSALKGAGYELSSIAHEGGASKAWLRKAGKVRRARSAAQSRALGFFWDEPAQNARPTAQRETARLKKLLAKQFGSLKSWRYYGSEFVIAGERFRLVVNQESDTGNGSGVFVSTWKERC